MKTLPCFAFAAAAALASLLATDAARASACSGIEAQISDLTVEVTPETSCIVVTVAADGCGDQVKVDIVDNCEGNVTMSGSLCEHDATTCTIAPGESGYDFPDDGDDGPVDVTYDLEVDGTAVQVHVTFDVEYVGGEDAMGEGCSAAVGPARGCGTGAALLIAGIAAAARARRKRRA